MHAALQRRRIEDRFPTHFMPPQGHAEITHGTIADPHPPILRAKAKARMKNAGACSLETAEKSTFSFLISRPTSSRAPTRPVLPPRPANAPLACSSAPTGVPRTAGAATFPRKIPSTACKNDLRYVARLAPPAATPRGDAIARRLEDDRHPSVHGECCRGALTR